MLDNAFQAWHEHALIKLQHNAYPNKIRIMITSIDMSTWTGEILHGFKYR